MLIFIMKKAVAEGIRPEVAWAQTMLETNWLKFGGRVNISQFNFAGLGATDNGAAGADFSGYGNQAVRMGVRARYNISKRMHLPKLQKQH